MEENYTYKLNQTEIEDIEDSLSSIEDMYKFKFEKNELQKIKTFEELCNLIISKIELENIESCTNQQAFYKLRKCLLEENISEKKQLKPNTNLEDLIPKKNRRNVLKSIENKLNLDFRLSNLVLEPNKAISILSFYLFLISIITLFINFIFGITGILIAIFGFYLSDKFGKNFNTKTVGDLTKIIVSGSYLNIRSQKNTVNRTELKNVITSWFSVELGVEENKLKRATFI